MSSTDARARTVLKAAGLIALGRAVGAPLGYAVPTFVVTEVKEPVTAKVRSSSGARIDSTEIPELGAFEAPGSPGAVDVRTFGGGGGVLGVGDCDADDPPPDRPNVVTVPAGGKGILTAVVLTGDNARLTVTLPGLASEIGPEPVAVLRANPDERNAVLSVPNGWSVAPSSIRFECTELNPVLRGSFILPGQ